MRTPAQTRATFAHYFETWDIQLPEELPEGEGCRVPNDRGWSIRVRIDRADDEHVVEVYARHRMTNDRHFSSMRKGGSKAWKPHLITPSIPQAARKKNAPRSERVARKTTGESTKRCGNVD
ncbi:MAG TPA: hypothetical protein VHP57_02005 [Acidimicrobiia bacterium]|nr:hypothetical protein [Acidimicrobiia bacterium]